MVDTIREKVILIMCSHVRRNARISERFAFLLCISNDSTLQILCGSTHNICNEEGKLEQLPLNRVLCDEETGQPLDVIAGTFFICGAPANSSEFASLSDEQLQKYQQKFQSPELILPDDEGIMVIRGMGGM